MLRRHGLGKRRFMESREHIHSRRGVRGRARGRALLGLALIGLALLGGVLWLRGRGPDGVEDGVGPGAVGPATDDPGEGTESWGQIVEEPVQLQRVDPGEKGDVFRQILDDPDAFKPNIHADILDIDTGPPWTIRFTPVRPDGLPVVGVDARLLTQRQVIPHWRDHIPVEPGVPVELQVDGPAELVLNGALWVATDAAALQSLDGRILRGRSSAYGGTRVSFGSGEEVDLETRVIDLGSVGLERPTRLGTVSLGGAWSDSVHVLVSGPGSSASPFDRSSGTRQFGLQGSARTLEVSAFLSGEEKRWSASAWTDENPERVSGEASIGGAISLDPPRKVGLELSLDVVALKGASRIVIPGADQDHGATLTKEAYRAMLGGARWTAVVPQSLVKAGKDRYDLGYVPFSDGPMRIEVWSVRDKSGLRSLLFQTKVDVQGDVLPVMLR